jgi:hypothetical protein
MTTHNNIEKPYWVIPETKHFGELTEGMQISSKHEIETFATESEWKARLTELNIDYEPIHEDY